MIGSVSTQPDVFSDMVHGLFYTCVMFQTKSKVNIKQLWTNIVIKLIIDRIGGELVT